MVVAKLDAGDDKTFRLINRPADEKLNMGFIVNPIAGMHASGVILISGSPL